MLKSKIYIKILLFSFIYIFGSLVLYGQEPKFSSQADSLAQIIPALNQSVNISVSGVNFQEFIRSVANASGLNLNVDPSVQGTIINNFQETLVKDILSFLEQNYPIEITTIGNIINIKEKPFVKSIQTNFKGVKYDSLSNKISLDYYQVPLNQVAREITKITDYNIILSPLISNKEVGGYIENMKFKGAIEQFAYSNNLSLKIADSLYYILDEKPSEAQALDNNNPGANFQNNNNSKNKAGKDGRFELKVTNSGNNQVVVYAENAPISEVLKKVGNELKINYFLPGEMEGTISMNYSKIDYESFLNEVLKNTDYVFQKNNNIYIIGKKDLILLKDYNVFQFKNRTIETVIKSLPEDLIDGLIIGEFPDLNSIIISGVKSKIDNLTKLLNEVDKTVPVILIEVIIIDVNKNYTISTGIDAGLGEAPITTKGKVFPKLDIQIGANEINKIINGFNGFGVINMGNVNANFYLTLKALEEQGILNVNSTPQLTTLNSHEATMSIGNTEYYLEEQSNYIGTQDPQLSTTQIYKPVNAELAITIKPVVSGDDQITLDIKVEQSDFTERISQTAPPGSVSRTFQSIIRVKNQETIILGGLEQKKVQDSSSGVPFLSRIPIIKWLFSSRTRVDSNSKLSIFIKPTIIG